MSKPRLIAAMKVVINPSASMMSDKRKIIQVFRNNLKRGSEFSFSIDKLTTDPARKKEIFNLINKEFGQYFPNGAIPDKDEKFRFYGDNERVWRENQLGTKIEQLLTKEFGNAQAAHQVVQG